MMEDRNPIASAVVTGSSGFIGGHLCTRLARAGANGGVWGLDVAAPPVDLPCQAAVANIQSLDAIERTLGVSTDVVFHLAAKAEVVVPFGELPDLNSTNVTGTINILTALSPQLLVFASTSAVYGNAPSPAVGTDWRHVNPVGLYGMTKATAELACGDWARQTGGAVASFRLGNVIGPRCRGLIPYLVRHAMQHPDGSVPVRMRGAGQIIRDYVPVDYVVEIFHRASRLKWPAHSALAFNIGTGRGLTNGEVAAITRDALRNSGYELTFDFSDPLAPGEARQVVLDMEDTVRRFDAPPPSPDDVRDAVAAAVASFLEAR